jgi:hypothetical protein
MMFDIGLSICFEVYDVFRTVAIDKNVQNSVALW